MRLLFFGNGERGSACLEALIEAGHAVAGVVVHADRGDGPIAERARRENIPTFAPRQVNDPGLRDELLALRPDLSVMAGYARILRPPLLACASLGTINLHGGRLPGYRGGSPINWQIINGETWGACTILYADEGIDTGDVIAERRYEIGPDTTAGEVVAATLAIFPGLLLDVLERFAQGPVVGKTQDARAGRYWCKRHPADGLIDWTRMTDREVHNLVRGLNGPGLPGAHTFWRGGRLVIHRTRLLEDTLCGPPGRIAFQRSGEVVVVCRDRGLLVAEVMLPDGVRPAASVLKPLAGQGPTRFSP